MTNVITEYSGIPLHKLRRSGFREVIMALSGRPKAMKIGAGRCHRRRGLGLVPPLKPVEKKCDAGGAL